MTAPSPLSAESVTSAEPARGSLPAAVAEAVAVAREWASGSLVALLLSGSHATGEAVWLELDGRAVTLSDVDVYAVLAHARACREAAARSRAGRRAAERRLREAGLAAPLEVGFLTPEGLSRMPAKPGTIELSRHGRVVAGDPETLARAPRWTARDVPAEETRLLLENRAFELLLAWPLLGSVGALERAQARHGTLKAAADLAAVLCLREGELPDGTAARIARAREHLAARPGLPPAAREGLERLWDSSRLWRSGGATPPDAGAAREEWRMAVSAWCAVWRSGQAGGSDSWEDALRSAARAPLPRRLRRSLQAPRAGSIADRVRLGLRGTPQHRINAGAAVLLLAADATPAAPRLPGAAAAALRGLGVSAAGEWEDARRDVVRAWDEVVLGGRRGTEGA
ncbi:MAG: hypothetical protein IT347_09145 [Candidatus Eisenbacteria bacterium]|nr:hypothetical protein [Candidatus Eisenbacteria bacterium]